MSGHAHDEALVRHALEVKACYATPEELQGVADALAALGRLTLPLPCGHPATAATTSQEGTGYCQWCADLQRLTVDTPQLTAQETAQVVSLGDGGAVRVEASEPSGTERWQAVVASAALATPGPWYPTASEYIGIEQRWLEDGSIRYGRTVVEAAGPEDDPQVERDVEFIVELVGWYHARAEVSGGTTETGEATAGDGGEPAVSSPAPFVLRLRWRCVSCGWTCDMDAPGYAGDGLWHYPDGLTPCGPIAAQKTRTGTHEEGA